MITAFVLAACSPHSHDAWPGAPTGPAILNTATVGQVVAAFSTAGLPVPNAHDVAQSRCPQIGCTDAVDSDTASIIKFDSTGRAERFAGATADSYQIEDLVLVFGQAVPAEKRAAYEDVARSVVTS
ncbi:MAG: hypothetical protein JO191_10645 [Mycobacteriaceae bacterium]|nr:hypothetical protein [Mycobacteriaceae bacterium]